MDEALAISSDCDKLFKTNEVAIVGAGLAGLMAALQLGQHGVKVTVYEARWQPGGRVLSNSTFSKGRITEEGAELIASFHTRTLDLARRYGLAVISRMDENLYERAQLTVKHTLDPPLSMGERKDMEDRVLAKIAKLASQINDPSQPWLQEQSLAAYDISVASALAEFCKLDKKNEKDARIWKEVEHLLVNDEVAPLEEMNFLGLLCKVRGAQSVTFTDDHPHDAVDWWELNRANLMRYWNELEIFRCADGCQALATEMVHEITTKREGKVLFDRAVTHVDLFKESVVVTSSKVIKRDGTLEKGPPIVRHYAYVILAIPPTVWDGVKIIADGKEADLKREIGVMSMGPAVKFFSEVKTRFWILENSAPYGGSSTLGQVWEGTDDQTSIPGNQGIVLSVFAGPILSGSKGPRVPTREEFKKGLRRLYPGYTENLRATLFSDWPNVPFIKTGYASPRKGEIFSTGKKLSEPFRGGRLFFAGEHTQMDFFGYMEGALRSGERAADKMLRQWCPALKKSAPGTPRSSTWSAEVAPLVEHDDPDEKKSEVGLVERVAAKITSGLKTTLAARPRLKTHAQRELVRFLVSMLSAYFLPKGYGRISSDGTVLRQSALGRITWQARPRFEHRVRLYLSARSPVGEKSGEHRRGHFSSIVLFATRLDGTTAIRASGVALHEMAHMARWMVLRFTAGVKEPGPTTFLAEEPWRLLDLRAFEASRDRIERYLPDLLRVVPFPETARDLASSLIEETFTYVLGVIIDEAIALAAQLKPGNRAPAVIATDDFSAERLVLYYALHRYDINRKQLASPAAVAVYDRMKDDVQELGKAIRAHLER